MELLKEWKPITHDALGREIEAHAHLTNFECCIDINQVVHLRNKTRKKELKQTLVNHGYLTFDIYQGKKTSILVHRLVALLWIENPDNKPCVDHIEHKEKLNNKLSNLRWATTSENSMNRGLNSNNKTGESGISENFQNGKPIWYVQVTGKDKKKLQKRLPRDPNSNVIPPEVIAWRDAAKKELHGEFACITRPPSSESSAEP